MLHPHDEGGIAEFRRAYRLITATDDLLRRFEADGRNVAVFRRQFDGWSRVPLMLDAVWNQATIGQNIVGQPILDQLEGFDAYLEGKVLTISDDRMPSLRALVAEANAALAEDDELPPQLVWYLKRLLSEIQLALDDEQFGSSFDFTEAVQRLWVTLNAAAEQSKSEARKGRWRNLVDQVIIGSVSSGAIEAAKAGIAITTGL